MKYFFLADGWVIGRIWEVGGQWRGQGRARQKVQALALGIQQTDAEVLWLYATAEDVLMVEVKPSDAIASGSLGQVILKRLIDADTAIARLAKASNLVHRDCP